MNLDLRPYSVPSLAEFSHKHVQFLKGLLSLETVRHNIIRTWQDPLEEVYHPSLLGDFMYIKVFQRTDACHHVGRDPFKCSDTAIKVKEKSSWIHASNVKLSSQEEGTEVPTRTWNKCSRITDIGIELNKKELFFFLRKELFYWNYYYYHKHPWSLIHSSDYLNYFKTQNLPDTNMLFGTLLFLFFFYC